MSSTDNLCKRFGPRSGSKPSGTLKVLLEEFFEKVNFLKKSADDNSLSLACKELKNYISIIGAYHARIQKGGGGAGGPDPPEKSQK